MLTEEEAFVCCACRLFAKQLADRSCESVEDLIKNARLTWWHHVRSIHRCVCSFVCSNHLFFSDLRRSLYLGGLKPLLPTLALAILNCCGPSMAFQPI